MHGITETDAMAFVGAVPWHGLGHRLEEGQPIETWLNTAHLDWRVELAPLFFNIEDPNQVTGVSAPWRPAAGHKVLYRTDTQEVLGVVGAKYVPAQNAEVLEFFREYLGVGDMTLDTAGSLWGGRYVWGLAKLRAGFTLAGGDEVVGHLLVANANVYGRGIVVKLVMERVVCHNTLTKALSESGRQVTIAHNRKFDETARRDAKERLGLATVQFDALKSEAETFATSYLDPGSVNRVLGAVFKLELEDDDTVVQETKASRRVRSLFEGEALGANLPSAAGTAWGLLNALTQYLDHEASKNQDTRLRNSWFQHGERFRNRARDEIWKVIGDGRANADRRSKDRRTNDDE